MANKIIAAFLLIACTISCEGKLTITGEAQCHGDSKINGKSCHDLCKCGSCKSTDNMKTWTCNDKPARALKLTITGDAQCHGDSKINGKSCHDLCKCGSCKSTGSMETWFCSSSIRHLRGY